MKLFIFFAAALVSVLLAKTIVFNFPDSKRLL